MTIHIMLYIGPVIALIGLALLVASHLYGRDRKTEKIGHWLVACGLLVSVITLSIAVCRMMR
jgi:hypothetical protein